METIDPKDFIDKATITYQYVDSKKDAWTVPVNLNEDRLNKVYDDLSITKLRIYPKTSTKFYELDVQ